jgi:hypothetical protein
MIPLMSHDMMLMVVEMACYFCAAIGVALTFLLAPRV